MERANIVRWALGIAALACAAQAQAQLYLGAGFGRSEVDEEVTIGLIDTGTVDATDTGFKVFGGYRINTWYALESAYVDLGEVTYSGAFGADAVTDGSVEVSGATVGPVVFLPLNPSFEVFGKAGLFIWEAEANDITGGAPFSSTEDGTDLYLGVGAAWSFTPNLVWQAEWEAFRMDDIDAGLLSLSLVYRF